MRRLLYVNLDFPPMSGPGIWRAFSFAKYLPENGYALTVLCSDRSPSRSRYDDALLGELPEVTQVHRITSRFQGDLQKHTDAIGDLPLPRPLKRPAVRAGKLFIHHYPDAQFHWAMKVAAKGAALVRRGEIDAMFTSGPPHVAHLAGLIVRGTKQIPWVMDYRDLWSDDRVQIKQTSYQQAFFERVEARVVKTVDGIVCVSPGYRDHLAERFGLPASKFHVIRNGHDIPAELLAAADERPKNTRLHLHFNGTPQYTHPFGLVVDTVARIVESHGRSRAPLVTFTGFPAKLAEQVEAKGLEDLVQNVGHMSRDDSIRYSLGCDVLIAMVNDANPLYRGTIPGKAYEALALGRHLLALLPKGSVVGPMIDEAKNGTLVNVGNPDEAYRAVVRLVERFEAGTLHDQDPALRARTAEKYSRRAQARQLAEVLDTYVRTA
ncbi:MAG: glycosyltransferase [Deltaproteobacteria bacterium]